MVLFGFFGAFLSALLETLLLHNYTGWHDFKVGERWYGSLLLGMIGYDSIFKKKYGEREKGILLYAICIGISIGKLGCFFAEHYGCYGIPTDLPWGVIFNDGQVSSIVPVHPIQIYDSIFHTVLFCILFFLEKRNKSFEKLGTIFVYTTSVYNILIEIIRTNESVILGLSLGQLFYILIVIYHIYSCRKIKTTAYIIEAVVFILSLPLRISCMLKSIHYFILHSLFPLANDS